MIVIGAKYINISRKVKLCGLGTDQSIFIAHKSYNKTNNGQENFSQKILCHRRIIPFNRDNRPAFCQAAGTSPVADLSRPAEENFAAPGRSWPSEKKVEDYFVSNLRMTPEEAQGIRSKPGVDGKVMLRLSADATIEGLLGNLEYYGLVRDKDALRYALENTADTLPGRTDALKVGDNTVDKYAYYRISEDMTAWEIADELLNNPTYFAYDEYHYLFMP